MRLAKTCKVNNDPIPKLPSGDNQILDTDDLSDNESSPEFCKNIGIRAKRKISQFAIMTEASDDTPRDVYKIAGGTPTARVGPKINYEYRSRNKKLISKSSFWRIKSEKKKKSPRKTKTPISMRQKEKISEPTPLKEYWSRKAKIEDWRNNTYLLNYIGYKNN